jgi:hypothetical protein
MSGTSIETVPVREPSDEMPASCRDGGDHESEARIGAQCPGSGERRSQPAEGDVGRVTSGVQLRREVIDGGEQPVARWIGGQPMVAAETERLIGQR